MSFETEPTINIVPELRFDIFSPYRIEVDGALNSPDSVSLAIQGLNGDGGNIWNFFVDGTPSSEPLQKNMAYDVGLDK